MTLTFDPVTLKTFSAMNTQMMNIFANYIKIAPLHTDILRHAEYVLMDNGRTTPKHHALRVLL